MPAERVAMRQVREIIRLKFSAGISTREIARRLGIAASTVRETLRRFEGAGLGWPLPDSMSDGDLEAALYNHGTKRGHRRHAEPDWPTVHRELKRKRVTLVIVWERDIIPLYPGDRGAGTRPSSSLVAQRPRFRWVASRRGYASCMRHYGAGPCSGPDRM